MINYPWDVSTATAEMLLVKIFFNSVISTRGARFMTIDIKNFYLGTTDGYISKFQGECMASLKQELLHRSSWKRGSTPASIAMK